MLESNLEKNSFASGLIVSHGGFPSTQLKPPSANTSGKARCQWKNLYWAVRRSASAACPAGKAPPNASSFKCPCVMLVALDFMPGLLKYFLMTNAAHQASA